MAFWSLKRHVGLADVRRYESTLLEYVGLIPKLTLFLDFGRRSGRLRWLLGRIIWTGPLYQRPKLNGLVAALEDSRLPI